MLKRSNLHEYQNVCVAHMLKWNDSMLWLQMGTGKTVSTITTIVDRMARGEVKKTLIFGPLRVIQSVWSKECAKWEHTKHLRCAVMHGNKKKRSARFFSNADIYLCNYEAMTWVAQQLDHFYISQGLPIPFEMVVYDEVSWLKNSNTRRMKGGKRDAKDKYGKPHVIKTLGWRTMIPHFKYHVGLTGSPASNGYIDLHGQYLAVDGGQRLGQFITGYKDEYFKSDFMGWSHTLSDENKARIQKKISDITFKLDVKDCKELKVPKVNYTNMLVELPPKAWKAYEEVQEELFTVLDSGEEVELFSKQAVSIKCLQIINGNIYTNETRDYASIHEAKLDALESVLEEAAGSPVLCSYNFKSDAKEIMKRFKKYKPVNLTAEKSADTQTIIDKWNEGKIKLLIGHPKSMGHGIDGLQYSGSIVVWYGLTWSLELYEQLNARINRQGQERPVSIIRILADNTIDMAVLDAILSKEDNQDGLKAALGRFRKGESRTVPKF
jgi:SNF2 family DNA or RNA helicase